MKLLNRIGRKLNPKTKREEIAHVEEDIETTPIRRPRLEYFVAADPMEVATDLGMVEIDAGAYVVVGETGQIKCYTEEAFKRAFVEGAEASAPSAPGATLDQLSGIAGRLDVSEGQIRNLNNFLTDLSTKVTRLQNDAAVAPRPTQPTG